MYRVAQAANTSLKLFSASMLVEVSRLHILALMPKGAGLRFFVNMQMLVYHVLNYAIKRRVRLNEVSC